MKKKKLNIFDLEVGKLYTFYNINEILKKNKFLNISNAIRSATILLQEKENIITFNSFLLRLEKEEADFSTGIIRNVKFFKFLVTNTRKYLIPLNMNIYLEDKNFSINQIYFKKLYVVDTIIITNRYSLPQSFVYSNMIEIKINDCGPKVPKEIVNIFKNLDNKKNYGNIVWKRIKKRYKKEIEKAEDIYGPPEQIFVPTT